MHAAKLAFLQPERLNLYSLQEQLTNDKQAFGTDSSDVSTGVRFPDCNVHPCPSGFGTTVVFVSASF